MAKDIEKKSKKERKHFFKDFKAELKKVIWPTPKQVMNNTIAVITIVLITAVIVFALDLVFGAINTHGIGTLRSLVSAETNTTDNTETEEHDHVHENEAEHEHTETVIQSETVDVNNGEQE